MNTQIDSTEKTIENINNSLCQKAHKKNVILRSSIRPSTSLKKSTFKVRSLRVKKSLNRINKEVNSLSIDL